ncbi:MAG: hypothetical protein H6659_17055 [Ardenticatenaceae bacterium]|nr:hypothetical protein [Ardenticatenaceae bacterium]
MERKSSIVGGGILILVGVFFLLIQFFPGFLSWFDLSQQWPLIIILIGGLFFLGAVFGTPPLAMPACIVGGTGLILYYQNVSGNWASWAYMWTLYPAFAGIGAILMHALSGNWKEGLREGANLLLISAVLFVIFAAFFNGLGLLGQFWPLLIIVAGLWLLWKNRSARPQSKK